jgi:hypothetical protein
MAAAIPGHRLVFVAGLHRSGTTPLARMMAEQPRISGLTGTGVEEDEGQHLQPVYPVAMTYGGPGRFARDRRAHLTETSPLATPANAERLIAAWSPYWDLNADLLLEKSPPNLVMGRFLQALFPGSAMIVVVRHPVVVALGTRKWAPRTTLHRLVGHWFEAHRTFAADLPHLERVHLLRYEDLVADAAGELARIQHFLGLAEPIPHERMQAARSSGYEQAWREMASGGLPARWARARIEADFGGFAADFGYDLSDPHHLEPLRLAGRPG